MCVSRKGGTGEVGGFTQAWPCLSLSMEINPQLALGKWAISVLLCLIGDGEQSSHLADPPFLAVKCLEWADICQEQ